MSDKTDLDTDLLDEELDLDNEDLNEEEGVTTSAADSLRPMGAPGESKSEMLATFATLLAQLGKEDLTDLFNRTIEQIGQEASTVPDGISATNAATIAAKQAVREDVEEMFASDDLSEEFKEKAVTIFEAAVNSRVTLEESRLQEEFETALTEIQEEFDSKLQEEANTIFEEVIDKLDQYLDYAVEKFMEENKVAIESGIRADLAENFIAGLHNLFSEHYITVPEEKIDIVAEMKEELESLRSKLDEEIEEKMELKKTLEESAKKDILDSLSEGLVETQIERFQTLAEGIDFNDVDSYKRKLEIVKENYFGNKTEKSTGMITEEIDAIDEDLVEETATVPGHMKKYVDALSKFSNNK